MPLEVDTSDEIKVQLSKNYIDSIEDYMYDDGDLSDMVIGTVTIDGTKKYLYAHTWVEMEGGYRLGGDTNRFDDEIADAHYLAWYIGYDFGDDPDILTLLSRNDYTIESINIVDMVSKDNLPV